MKFTVLFLAAIAAAANQQFFLKATSTDDNTFDKTNIKKVDSHPHVFSVGGDEGKDLVVLFQDDWTSLVDEDGRGVNVDSNTGEVGSSAPFGREPATPGFYIEDNRLKFNGEDHWRACPGGGDKYSLTNKDGPGCKTIYLDVANRYIPFKSDGKA